MTCSIISVRAVMAAAFSVWKGRVEAEPLAGIGVQPAGGDELVDLGVAVCGFGDQDGGATSHQGSGDLVQDVLGVGCVVEAERGDDEIGGGVGNREVVEVGADGGGWCRALASGGEQCWGLVERDEPAGCESFGGLVFWEVDGTLVSMAGYGGPTPNGIRVFAVYTPLELRRRGYATACVAALTERLLQGGRTFCFLSTDLANPTSNAVYQRIGYRSVIDVDDYRFHRPEG